VASLLSRELEREGDTINLERDSASLERKLRERRDGENFIRDKTLERERRGSIFVKSHCLVCVMIQDDRNNIGCNYRIEVHCGGHELQRRLQYGIIIEGAGKQGGRMHGEIESAL
jgi:hypothetical protein